VIAGLSPQLYPAAPPGLAIRVALALRRFFHKLADLMVPAEIVMIERASGVAATQILGAAARYRIADLIGDGALSGDELAARTATNADAMHRMMRAAATMGIFALDGKGRFANNRLSRALQSGRLARSRDFVEYFASKSNCDSWADFDGILKTGRNGFERVHGMSVWEWFDAHPDERETFAQAMMGMTVANAPTVAAIYPFTEVRRLCDVGGGRGTLLSELLLRHRHLEGVLCDGAGVIESAKLLLERRGVSARVQLVAGSFFDKVPAGCDAYLMKNVLHDWDDAACARILGVCRRAMEPGTRLLLVETLLEKNALHFGALADVQMMTVCSDGRERSRAEFERLLGAAGFKLARVFDTPTLAVLESLAI
jgi:hypothetical protein